MCWSYVFLFLLLPSNGDLSLKHAGGFKVTYNMQFYFLLMMLYINVHNWYFRDGIKLDHDPSLAYPFQYIMVWSPKLSKLVGVVDSFFKNFLIIYCRHKYIIYNVSSLHCNQLFPFFIILAIYKMFQIKATLLYASLLRCVTLCFRKSISSIWILQTEFMLC
jgi:hypothetical protein